MWKVGGGHGREGHVHNDAMRPSAFGTRHFPKSILELVMQLIGKESHVALGPRPSALPYGPSTCEMAMQLIGEECP